MALKNQTLAGFDVRTGCNHVIDKNAFIRRLPKAPPSQKLVKRFCSAFSARVNRRDEIQQFQKGALQRSLGLAS